MNNVDFTNTEKKKTKAVVPNLCCPKVYFSSSQHPEVYQSSVNITNLYTSYPACITNFTKLFLLSHNHKISHVASQNVPLSNTHTRTHHNLFENQTEK